MYTADHVFGRALREADHQHGQRTVSFSTVSGLTISANVQTTVDPRARCETCGTSTRPLWAPLAPLLALVLGGDGRTPELAPLKAPARGVATVETRGGGFSRTERWVWAGDRVESAVVTVTAPTFVLEAIDSNGDLLVDEETRNTLADGGVARQVRTPYPLDGGFAWRRTVSLDQGGNRRRVEQQQWRDGGWVSVEAFDGKWPDEKHLR